MPSKKKRYNARFPAGRIKKIMQSDEEIGKVAQAVPVIISRTLELFVESLLTKTLRITNSRNAKILSTSHMKQCIISEQRFDFLKELVKNIPDISMAEEAAINYNEDELHSSPEEQYPDSDTPYDLSLPSTSMRVLPNGSSTLTRSQSLNGSISGSSACKRPYQKPVSPSVIMQTATVIAQLQNATEPLPAKLARSESTPTPTSRPRGRPPASTTHRLNRQSKDTAIPAAISTYELSKPIVKIDYSNMKIPAADLGNTDAAPVINIDLTNIVAAANISPTSTLSFQALPANTNINVDSGGSVGSNNNNSKAKIASSVNHIGGGSSSALFIPKAPAASAPLNDTFFELDEDYDNI